MPPVMTRRKQFTGKLPSAATAVNGHFLSDPLFFSEIGLPSNPIDNANNIP